MTTTATQIADFFINFSQNHGDCTTNLKLQKLVYYAQAWNIALYDEALFEEDFEAWVHGPVCPSLYSRFKKYRWNAISEEVKKPELSDKVQEHLLDIIDAYGVHSGYELEQMTHKEKPWVEARGNTPLDEISTAIITKNSMKEYYSAV
jgi:uncharacterized phage-associated protein